MSVADNRVEVVRSSSGTSSLAQKVFAMPEADKKKFINSLTNEEAAELHFTWREWHARPEQLAPGGDWWDIWLLLAGRGFGKTRTGAEFVREEVNRGVATRIAIVGETAADVRDVLVEGPAGIINVFPKSERPKFEPTKRRITFNTGAVATLYNATEPDQLRGPEHDLAWSDELAKWRYARETWDQLQFGLRIGDKPRQIVTTTPRPIELVKALVAGGEGSIVVTRGRTLDNSRNLAPAFLKKIVNKYEGTRLGRQELSGEILGDLPGALWRAEQLESYRATSKHAVKYGRIVIAVDPAVTAGEESNEHGVVAVALGDDARGYFLEDASCRGGPTDWARRAIALYDKYSADCIVVEVNQGGDMVASTLRSVRLDVPIKEVRASRGKHVRAEPIAALYEQGRIVHVGTWSELEDQMCQMTVEGYEGAGSPDRVDATVWGFTELFPQMIAPIRQKIPNHRMRRVV